MRAWTRVLLTVAMPSLVCAPRPARAASPAAAPSIGLAATEDILFAAQPDPEAVARCQQKGTEAASSTAASATEEAAGTQIRCLIAARYSRDSKASQLALELFDRTGGVAGLLPEQDFDGGYRGLLHLVPQLPVEAERKHLEFVVEALLALDDFFAVIERQAGAPPRYRWRALALRFFLSVKARTPAAFADDWTVSYNVRGTLNYSTRAVRDLLFHEIFHLNDFSHGNWSAAALAEIHGAIVARCGRNIGCLEPYAPGWLKVRGGTYYAFMPGNGVEEYAAELALNYLREQLAVQAGSRIKRPFKCGPPENARAWKLLADEFFAGVDLVPPCPTKPTGDKPPAPPRAAPKAGAGANTPAEG